MLLILSFSHFLFVGATPKLSPVFQIAAADKNLNEKIKIFRNIFDFEEAQELFETSKNIAIVGGGFLGSELACAMARKGTESLLLYLYEISLI